MDEQASQSTREEIHKNRRRCWRPHCENKAWLEDWMGWKWCLKDYLRSTNYHAEGSIKRYWFELCHNKIF